MTVLEIQDLTVGLRAGRAARPILSSVSLHVEQGETVGLVGESGSGKSVTCRAVLGQLPPGASATGTIAVEGVDVLTMGPAQRRELRSRQAAMVFQDPRAAVDPLRRVGDFVTEGLRTNLALDVSIQAQILTLLRDIRRERAVAYLFVSHDLAAVRSVTDHVLLRRGRVVEVGATEQVLAEPRQPYTRLLLASVPRPGWDLAEISRARREMSGA